MGAWHFIEPRLRRMLPDERDARATSAATEAASPATGSYKIHQAEEAEIVVNRAFAR